MLRKSLLALMLAGSMIVNSQAIGQPVEGQGDFTGNSILRLYASDQSFLLPYVIGAHDMGAALSPSHNIRMCMPDDITMGKLADVFLEHLRGLTHRRLEANGALIFFVMMIQKYKCPEEPAPRRNQRR